MQMDLGPLLSKIGIIYTQGLRIMTMDLTAKCLERGHAGQRGDSHAGRAEWDSKRFHRATQRGVQLKTHEFFISESYIEYFQIAIDHE